MSAMNTFERGFFWNNYKSIESDFLRFMKTAPFCDSNIEMYSPKLTGLLLQIGGYVDSAFKEMANYFGPTMPVNRKRGNKPVVDIVDAFCMFETIYNLSTNNSGHLVAKLDFGDQELCPFREFQSIEFNAPAWWTAYNEVKHEYSLNYREANMQNVLVGLAGAFLINVVHFPSIKILWQLGHLKTGFTAANGGFQEFYLTESQFDDYINARIPDFAPPSVGTRTETSLFLYVHQ